MSRQANKLLTAETKELLAEDRVLVYHYRANGSPAVKNGLAVIPRHELEAILRTHPTLTAHPKPLPPRARGVDIYQRDLLPTTSTSTAAADVTHGNAASNVAGVQLPLIIWLEGLLRGKGKGFKEVLVLSERVGRGA